MKTNTTISAGDGARVQSEQSGTQKKWNLFIGNEPYGFVHANSEAEALDRVAAFRKPFRAELAE
jgi:hypothetical protein